MKTLENKMSKMKTGFLIVTLLVAFLSIGACTEDNITAEQKSDENITNPELSYVVVGTNQTTFYNNQTVISAPIAGESFYGQDATYSTNEPGYTNNGDGTITDNNTGLMWQKDPGEKMTYPEALDGAKSFDLAGYTDWRLPTVKELYSLIIFSGLDPDPMSGFGSVPFINTDFFNFVYGDPADGDRIIDSQYATSTLDVGGSQFGGGHLMFGVNFADGRIKGYPTGPMPGQTTGKTFFVLYVRGNESYGENDFSDNGDGTITDNATGLMWMQSDSGEGMSWQEALEYAEGKTFAGYSDWRLPNAKELQSIVDYTRAPGATNSAAIDPVFNCTGITNEGGQPDFAYYWTGTTHANGQGGGSAAYISFGRALGYYNGEWQDVHGAGAQRSDPKMGDASNWPTGHGPQGDAIRINNFVRLVRNAK
jgi:hypothetical protein